MKRPNFDFLKRADEGKNFPCRVVFALLIVVTSGFFSYSQGQVKAAFIVDHPASCQQASINFTDQSTGSPTSWLWNFGDGKTSVLQNPSHNYITPSTYKVILLVSNGVTTDTTSKNIVVNADPTVNFSMDSTSGCYPLTVNFTDQSSAGTGSIISWTWDFGDGSPFSTIQNPTHTYISSGNFPVVLTIKNSAGCVATDTTPQFVTTGQGVSIDFTASDTFSCTSQLKVQFTASTTSASPLVYQWNFGDGSSATGQTITHTYTQKGTFNVSLTAGITGGGCQNSVIKKKYIHVGDITSDFTVPNGCAGIPLPFVNTSTPLPVSSVWKFNDGTTINGINASHAFSIPGSYQVTLYNQYAGGCLDSMTKSIKTYPSPTANFQTNKQLFCGTPATVPFQNLSTGSSSWNWAFGNGDNSAVKNPTYTYLQGGYYNVSLIVQNANGCADTVTKPNYLHIDAPDLKIVAKPPYGCIPDTTSFSLPFANPVDISAYDWDFGDATAHSNNPTPSHIFTKEGNYPVTVQVTTPFGCKLSSPQPLIINAGTPAHVDFSATPTQVCRNTPVQFTNESSPPGTIWNWFFPPGGDSISGENPIVSFADTGTYDVVLQVYNNGCLNTGVKHKYITVLPPKAAFTVSGSCDTPHTYHFFDQSIGDLTRTWNFGDGTTDTSQNPTHTYANPGAYHVVLVVSNGQCQDSTDWWPKIIDEHPQITVTPQTVCHGDSVTLSVGKFYSDQFENWLLWYDGKGDSSRVTMQNGAIPTHQYSFVYSQNGTYTPSLKIFYVNGCYDSVSGPKITVQGPKAGFTLGQATVCQGSQVTFHDNSTQEPSSIPIKKWTWNFSDGTGDTTTVDSVTHTYTQSGNFNVSLLVTDANGCSDRASGALSPSITVNPSTASFSTEDTLVCPGRAIDWVNNSEGNNATYLWNFGNGDTSTAQNPSNQSYSTDGIYSVSLKLVTQEGCTDSILRSNYIRVGTPHALMGDASPVAICRLYQDTSINLSQNYLNILWKFGDGSQSPFDTAYHTYNIPGKYVQTLYAYGFSDGCVDSATRQITIGGPVGKPVLIDTSGCEPLKVTFSAINVDRALTYQWDFGNGVTSDPSASGNTTYTYNTKGIFHPTLKLTDDTGCYVIVPFNDTLNVVVDSAGVNPDYTWPQICDSNQVKFNFTGGVYSADSLGKPASYQWNFGDPLSINDTSTADTPGYRYPNPGSYNGYLEVKSFYGCDQKFPFTVSIPDSVPITVNAVVNPTAICQGKSVQLQASSNIGQNYIWSPPQSISNPNSAITTASPDTTTTYLVTASSKGNCQTDTASVQVVVHDNPQVDAGPDQIATTGSTVQLQATGSNDIVKWQWSPSDYLSCTDCANPESTPTKNITYWVTATTAFGCATTDSTNIFLICDEGKVFIPNTFTPNGDGLNDIFYPRGRGVKIVLYFRIYNRFGQLVFERTNFQLNDQSMGWDGTFNGQKLDPQVFVWTTEMICDNNKIFKLSGNITLLR